jgi:hypothetical protein
LNKQYTKEEYEELVPKIIEHMKKSGEWGQFFPVGISPFAYNETVAIEYYPLSKEEVLAKGWRWQEESESGDAQKVSDYKIPDNISDVSDEILGKGLKCEVTGRPYKIIQQELEFYRKMNLPIPRRCPDQRHIDRIALRDPRKLWERKCTNCGKMMSSVYAPERSEKVYCEECYLKAVY